MEELLATTSTVSKEYAKRMDRAEPAVVGEVRYVLEIMAVLVVLALAAGADLETAAWLGNVAGGLAVEKLGTATVAADEILEHVRKGLVP